MSLCLPVGLRAGRRVPKPTNHKLPQSSGVNGLFSQCQDRRGEEGIRECVCLRVGERPGQRGDTGNVASAHRHQKDGVEWTGGVAFAWCGDRGREGVNK